MYNALQEESQKNDFKFTEAVNMFGITTLDKKPDFEFKGHYCKIPFAKLVEGGFIVASDEYNNILLLDSQCKLLQSLPYGKQVVDAIADKNHIFVGIEFHKLLIIEKKHPFCVVDKISFDNKVHVLCRNERNELRVVGANGMNNYVDLNDLTHGNPSKYRCLEPDIRQNLHYTKHGTDSWLIVGADIQVLTNFGLFKWLGYDPATKKFCTFEKERVMKEKTDVGLKGSKLLKIADQHLLAMRAHPDWWAEEANFVVAMTADEAVHLIKCTFKQALSGQTIKLDPIERGINKLSWIKEPSDGSQVILGVKQVKNDKGEEISSNIWIKTLKQKDFDEITGEK